MNKKPLISIIIPCFNQEKWIKETIESCLAQKKVTVETIVLDDGSKDSSLDIIRSFEGKIKWETGPNKGVNPTRNRGFQIAAGEYLKFLDADDKLQEDSLIEQVETMEHGKADVCLGDWRYLKIYNNGKKEISESQKGSINDEDFIAWLLRGQWCPPFVYLYRTDFLRQHHLLWNENLGFPDDFEFILRVALAKAKVADAQVLTGYYRKYAGPRLSQIKNIKMVHNTVQILELAERELTIQSNLKAQYKSYLCGTYLRLAKNIYSADILLFEQLIKKIYQLKPDYQPPKFWYALLVKWFGYEKVERWLEMRRKIRNKIIKEKF